MIAGLPIIAAVALAMTCAIVAVAALRRARSAHARVGEIEKAFGLVHADPKAPPSSRLSFRPLVVRRAKTLIDLAISEQLQYELLHGARQKQRLHKAKLPRDGREYPHAKYDADQRAQSVELRVRAAYTARRETPPQDLPQLIAEALA